MQPRSAQPSHAYGTNHPEKRAAWFNSLVAEYRKSTVGVNSSVASQKLRELVDARNPNLRKHLGTRGGISQVIKLLFPDPRCPGCGAKFQFSLTRDYCSGKCHNLAKYGVENPAQLPGVVAKRKKTLLQRTGYEHALQNPESLAKSKQSCRATTGTDFPLQNLKVLKQARATLKARTGYEYYQHSPEAYARVRAAYTKRTGYAHQSQNPDVKLAKIATNLRKRGVENPFQDLKTQLKIRRTLQARYGVDNPTQSLEILRKVFKTQHRIKEFVYQGRTFRFQGWEDTIIRKLVDCYGKRPVVTQFDKTYPEDTFSRLGTFPDVYVKSIDTFVEVKSTWTLLGKRKTLAQNRQKAKYACARSTCRWVVVTDHKKGLYVVLPTDWYKMKCSELCTLLDCKRPRK